VYLSRKSRKKREEKEKEEEEKRKSEKRSTAMPLKEVYFANKTGPVPCLLKQ